MFSLNLILELSLSEGAFYSQVNSDWLFECSLRLSSGLRGCICGYVHAA